MTNNKSLERRILAETKKIEKMEKQIKRSEETISRNIKSGIKVFAKDGINHKEAGVLHRSFIRKVSRHKFLFTIIVTLGVVLVWRGLWDVTAVLPVLKDSTASLLIGFFLLWAIEKYSDIS